MRVEENENVDDFLEHFGVKGMRWGHRKAEPSIRQRNRELNKASRDRDKASRDKEKAKNQFEIEEARRRHYGGENAKRLNDARAKYKKDKIEIGSREARKLLKQVENETRADYLKSQEYLNGKELAKDLLISMAIPDSNGIGGRVAREIGLQRKYGEKK